MVVEFWMIVKNDYFKHGGQGLTGKTFSPWERPLPAVPIESLQGMVN